MRKSLAFLLAASLGACTAAQVASVQTGIASAKIVIDQGACDAQAAANDATTILTAAGDTAGAAQTAKVSTTAGSACMTLAAPAPVAPVATPVPAAS